MIKVTRNIAIDEKELSFSFVHSSGPGGQNVNKVATAVQLKFNVGNSSLPESIKERFIQLNKNKLSKDLTLTIDARRYRSQDKNKQDAVNRLASLIKEAARKQKKRIKTKPTESAKAKRLESKRKRSQLKKERQSIKKHDY